jgi:DNA polymerase III subunit delta'
MSTVRNPDHAVLGPNDHPVARLFADVVGQREAVAGLRAASIHAVHAYLLVGQAGAGSREATKGFSAALLCATGGCGVCEHCRKALAGTHPDVVVVERSGASLGVEEARRLIGLAQRRPIEAQRQVLVVTDVHLALRSAPALLKTVEEPPASTVFVLLADDIPPELVTVASRCVEIDFPPVPAEVIVTWLVNRGTEASMAAMVAESCGGDIARAQLLVDDPGFASRLDLWRSIPERIDGSGSRAVELARDLLASAEDAVAPLQAAHTREVDRLTEEAQSLGEKGLPGRKELTDRQHREERRWRIDEVRAGLGVLARAYRDRSAVALKDGSPNVSHTVVRCSDAVSLITQAADSLQRNPNEPLMLSALLLRLGQLEE